MIVSCAICNETLTPSDEMYATPCGHVFHFGCLSQWLPRSSTCPECRRKTTIQTIQKLYFNVNLDRSLHLDPRELQMKLDERNSHIKEIEKKIFVLRTKLESSEIKTRQIEEKYLKKEAAFDVIKQQYDHCRKQCTEIDDLKKKLKHSQERITLLKRLDELVESTASEVDSMMAGPVNARDLGVYVTVLKRELRSSEDKRKAMKEAFQRSQLEIINLKSKCNDYKKHLESCSIGSVEEKIKEYQIEKNSLLDRIKELEKFQMRKETVHSIENSGSPYLQVESSSVGMMPLRPLQNLKVDKRRMNNDNQFSILKKSRLARHTSMASSLYKAQ